MESTDDPLTDSHSPSTTTDPPPPPPPPPPSQQLHPNPGTAKAGSNTSSCRAPWASRRQQGVVTRLRTGKPGSDCSRERAFPRTTDGPLAINHFLLPVGWLPPAICRGVNVSCPASARSVLPSPPRRHGGRRTSWRKKKNKNPVNGFFFFLPRPEVLCFLELLSALIAGISPLLTGGAERDGTVHGPDGGARRGLGKPN